MICPLSASAGRGGGEEDIVFWLALSAAGFAHEHAPGVEKEGGGVHRAPGRASDASLSGWHPHQFVWMARGTSPCANQ